MRYRARIASEHGAVAIIVAICTVLLFGLAALVVDLGNTQDRKQASQNDADYAALAAAPYMSMTFTGTPKDGSPTDINGVNPFAAVTQTAEYLSLHNNQPQNDNGGYQAVTADQLVDGNLSNGEVCYGTFVGGACDGSTGPGKFTVLTPSTQVDFHFAEAMPSGPGSTDLQSMATVGLGTPGAGTGMMPYYAFQSCGWGPQTISQPTHGHAAPPVNLKFQDQTNSATLSSVTVTPPDTTAPINNPNQIDQGDTSSSLIITGSGLSAVKAIGFFESNYSQPPKPVTISQQGTGSGEFTIDNDGQITVHAALPTDVTSVVDTWYIRVQVGAAGTGNWSAVIASDGTLLALPFFVGEPEPQCLQGNNTGNFGAIALSNPNGNGQDGQVAQNLAGGLVGGSLALYPNPSSPYTCPNGDPDAVLWANAGTNCVDTETGNSVTINAITWGLITGANTTVKYGRLEQASASITAPGFHEGTSDKCVNGSVTGFTNSPLTGSYQINDDTLSCFFTPQYQGSDNPLGRPANLGDIDQPSYTLNGPVFDASITCSPRFFYVPIFGANPGPGGSSVWQITAFRPAFITDQGNSSTYNSMATTTNGLNPDNSAQNLSSVQLVLFNPKALPDEGCQGNIGAWLGPGTPSVPLLTN